MSEYYFSYQDIHKTIKRSAQEIAASNFDPDLILAIGSGGFIPARIMRTFINKPILTVAISYYGDANTPKATPQKYQWLEGISIENKKILLIDEVDDTRATMQYCLTELLAHNPAEIAVFVLHNKLKTKIGQYPASVKRIFIGENLQDHWIHYPWDAENIDEHDQHT